MAQHASMFNPNIANFLLHISRTMMATTIIQLFTKLTFSLPIGLLGLFLYVYCCYLLHRQF